MGPGHPKLRATGPEQSQGETLCNGCIIPQKMSIAHQPALGTHLEAPKDPCWFNQQDNPGASDRFPRWLSKPGSTTSSHVQAGALPPASLLKGVRQPQRTRSKTRHSQHSAGRRITRGTHQETPRPCPHLSHLHNLLCHPKQDASSMGTGGLCCPYHHIPPPGPQGSPQLVE